MSNTTRSNRGALARFSRRVVAIVAECNNAQNQISNARHTPEHY
jgi:hypothetical protein